MQKIKIFVLQDFLHQTDFGMERFFSGEVRKVSPENAAHFCGQAWASLEPSDRVMDEANTETVLAVDGITAQLHKTVL